MVPLGAPFFQRGLESHLHAVAAAGIQRKKKLGAPLFPIANRLKVFWSEIFNLTPD
jgi:hypothetical protein